MRVFDGFTYNGEIAMLNLRLRELRDVVDLHIVVESTKTFAGGRKSVMFDPGLIPDEVRHKVRHVVVDPPEHLDGAWSREYHQRDGIRMGIPSDCGQDDLLLISDVDEIPNPDAIRWLRNQPSPLHGVWAFCMDFYYYDIHHLKHQKWFHARAVSASIQTPPSLIRMGQISGGVVPVHGGWHLSYFMTPDEIAKKIQSFSHQELNTPEFNQASRIQERISHNKDLFDRPNEHFVDRADAPLPIHIGLLKSNDP